MMEQLFLGQLLPDIIFHRVEQLVYRKTGWLGPNLKTTFKPQIYQFFSYLVVKDLTKTPDFLSTKSQIWFSTDNSKILLFFTEI